MEILFLTSCLYQTGGVSRVLSCIASELTKHHNVTIINFEGETQYDKTRYGLSPDVKVVYWQKKNNLLKRIVGHLNNRYGLLKILGIKKMWDWCYLSKILQEKIIDYTDKNKIDAICGVEGNLAYLVGSISSRVKCKTIGWQHNSYDAYFTKKNMYYYNRSFMFESYVKNLDFNIVLNEYDAEMYKTNLGIESIVIYNPRSFISDKKTTTENKRFISCGGLRKAKGYDMLIDAFSIFAKQDEEWTLDIYGEGGDYQSLYNKIVKYNLENRVFLRGNTDDVKGKLIESSIYLLSSRWEGMPMAILEALECGVPVISFDISAIKPLIENEREGYIVRCFDVNEFATRMIELSKNERTRKYMGLNASQKSAHFSIEEIVKKWNSIL